MAFQRNKKRKITAILLALGATLATGFLAFAGALAIFSIIWVPILVAIFAAGVEGVVFWKNIQTSLKRILTPNFLEDAILEDKIQDLLVKKAKRDAETCENVWFLKVYQEQCERIEQLKSLPHTSDRDESLTQAKEELREMRKYFKNFINERPIISAGEKTEEFLGDVELKQFLPNEDKNAIRREIRRKILFTRLSWIAILISGTSSGLVGIATAKISISALIMYFSIPLTGIAVSAPVFGLAAFGALAYMFLIYKSISDIIRNDTVRAWTKFFQRKENHSNFQHALKIIGMLSLTVLIVSLGVFATVATAGTWWYAAKAGAALIPFIAQAGIWLRNITVPIMGATSLIFTVDNSLASLKELVHSPKSFQKAFTSIKKLIKLHLIKENIFQFLNPFRLVSIIINFLFKLIFFICHTISMGIMSDGFAEIPTKLTIAFNALSEALTDAHYFLPSHPHKGHGHDHDHGDIPGKLLYLILFIPRTFSTLWDFSFSQFNHTENRLTLRQAWEKAWCGLTINNANSAAITPQIEEQITNSDSIVASAEQTSSYKKFALYMDLSAAREKINRKCQGLPEEEKANILSRWKQETDYILLSSESGKARVKKLTQNILSKEKSTEVDLTDNSPQASFK